MQLTREIFKRAWTGDDFDLRVFDYCFKVDFEEWWQSLREGWGKEPDLDVDSHVMVWEHPIGERFVIFPDEENFHERQYIVMFTFEECEFDFVFKPNKYLLDEIDLYLFKGELPPYTPKEHPNFPKYLEGVTDGKIVKKVEPHLSPVKKEPSPTIELPKVSENDLAPKVDDSHRRGVETQEKLLIRSEVGKACWDGTIGELLALDRGEFKRIVKENFAKYIRKEMSYSEARSWWDCVKTLKWHVFNKFGERDLAKWKKLRISFEMVLPNQQRTDVLIFTERMIFVLEFKRKSKAYFGHLREVKAYCDKIEKWSEVCKGRKVRGIVVYTRMKEHCLHLWGRTRMCSSHQLKKQLLYLQPSPAPYSNLTLIEDLKPETLLESTPVRVVSVSSDELPNLSSTPKSTSALATPSVVKATSTVGLGWGNASITPQHQNGKNNYGGPSRSKHKKKKRGKKKKEKFPNSVGVSSLYSSIVRHIWPYSKDR